MKLTSIAHTALRLSGLALSGILLWHSPAKAQVGISPLLIETQETRGQSQGTITVSNSSNESFRARVYAEPFTYDRDAGFQTTTSNPNDLTPYLQFSPRELEVPAGSERRVRFVVRFPPSLPDGKYRTVIFTENLKETVVTENGFTTRIVPRIGVVVYVRKGNVSSNLTVDSASWNESANQMQVLVRNTGNASAITTTNWTLRQGGTVVTQGTAPGTTVIAEGERNILLPYTGENGATLAPGNYQLTGEVMWGGDSRNKVPFTANLTIPANRVNSSSRTDNPQFPSPLSSPSSSR